MLCSWSSDSLATYLNSQFSRMHSPHLWQTKYSQARCPLTADCLLCTWPTNCRSTYAIYLLAPLQGHIESAIPNSKQFSAFIATLEIAHEVSFGLSHCSSGFPHNFLFRCKVMLGIGHKPNREVLSCRHHLFSIPRILLQIDPWHSNGFPSFSHLSQIYIVIEDVEQRALVTLPGFGHIT